MQRNVAAFFDFSAVFNLAKHLNTLQGTLLIILLLQSMDFERWMGGIDKPIQSSSPSFDFDIDDLHIIRNAEGTILKIWRSELASEIVR